MLRRQHGVIGLLFSLCMMMVRVGIGLMVASVALCWWLCLALLLFLPGDKRATRTAMRGASRSVSRALARMI